MGSHKVLISVVVPVFNTAKYLPKCLDSVLGQSLRDIEVICVDDHSSDRSRMILEEYAARDPRISLMSLPENHGVGYVRNLGMKIAQGDYIYFLDSDDWIDQDYLSEMYSHAVSSGQDIVINANWYHEFGHSCKRREKNGSLLVKENVFYYSPVEVQRNMLPVVWCRLFKRSFLQENSILFPLIRSAEDVYFVWLSEILQEKIYIFKGPYYHYFQRRRSLSGSKDNMWHHLKIYNELLIEYRERNIPPASAKRFFFWPERLRINNEDRFNFARSFFETVETDVKAAPGLYWSYDCYVMKAVLSCSSCKEWRLHFPLGLYIGFYIRLVKNRMSRPTVESIIDGTWKI